MQSTVGYTSPFGEMVLAADEDGLTGLWFRGQKYFGRTLGAVSGLQEFPVFREAECWLDRYFSGKDPGPVPTLHLMGTAFQNQVWELLLEIPYGKTVTYGELARQLAWRLGKDRVSAQAVGGAVGHNPISVIVPCHRVVGAGGSLTGYAGGLEKKTALLKLEGAWQDRFFLPKRSTAP